MAPGMVGTRTANRLGAAFYSVTALVALFGATSAAMEWLAAPLPLAAVAVAVVELGGIVLAVQGDVRRRLGEHAVAYRTLSAAVAAFAVVFQWLGHGDHRQGLFFAGVSTLAYVTWLVHSGARRRDQLRGSPGHAGLVAAASPAYGLEWLRHPWLTRRARDLYRRDTSLGLFGSLDGAREQVRQERRRAALARLLRRKLAEGRDTLAADIAVATYDLDVIAGRLAAGADYDGLAGLLAADLTPARLTRTAVPGGDSAARVVPSVVSPGATGQRHEGATKAPNGALQDDTTGANLAPLTAPRRRQPGRHEGATEGATEAPPGRQDSASRVASAVASDPGATQASVAAQLGLARRTVQRYWPRLDDEDGPPAKVNGQVPELAGEVQP